jgi:hypothetical protein
MVRPEPRVDGVRVGGVRIVAGRVGAGGWASGNAVCSRYFVVVVAVPDVCGCGLAGWASKLACMFVRTLLAASDALGRAVGR